VERFIELINDRVEYLATSHFPANIDYHHLCNIMKEEVLEIVGEPECRYIVTIRLKDIQCNAKEHKRDVNIKVSSDRHFKIEHASQTYSLR